VETVRCDDTLCLITSIVF
jgi:hypothetical protein